MNYSLEEIADGLLSSDRWYRHTITYSFRDTLIGYETTDEMQGFAHLSNSAKQAVHYIMQYLEDIINIDFVYSSTSTGDIVIGATSMDDTILGYAYMPGGTIKDNAGDIYLNSSFGDMDYSVGGMGYSTIIHELGHSMGLDHPFGDGYTYGVDINQSVMSYNNYTGHDEFNNINFDVISYSSYSEADIIALQSIYGATDIENNDEYMMKDILFGDKIISHYITIIDENIYTLYDMGGIDTINLYGIGRDSQYINMTAGSQSIITYNDVTHYVNITTNSTIENLIGSQGDDYIVLNEANNVVDSKEGYDKVYINSSSLNIRFDKLGDKIIISSLDSGLDEITNSEEVYVNNSLVDSSLYNRESVEFHNNVASEIGRLYLSVFDRLADKAGIQYWIGEYENGMKVVDIAGCFVNSAEFISTYGQSIDNRQYIELLYENVLYRNSDEAGMAYWLNEMNRGFLREDVLLSFSNSSEFIEFSGVYFEGGIWVT